MPFLLASSQGDAFDGAKNLRTWADGAILVTPLVVGGDGHATAIYYQIRSRVLSFARDSLKPRKNAIKRAKTK